MGTEHLTPAKPGDIRNPAGKPKGKLNYKTIVRKYLAQKFKPSEIDFDMPFLKNLNRNITLEEMMVLRMIKRVIDDGDPKTYKILMDRAYGLLDKNVNKNLNIKDQKILELNISDDRIARIVNISRANRTILEAIGTDKDQQEVHSD